MFPALGNIHISRLPGAHPEGRGSRNTDGGGIVPAERQPSAEGSMGDNKNMGSGSGSNQGKTRDFDQQSRNRNRNHGRAAWAPAWAEP